MEKENLFRVGDAFFVIASNALDKVQSKLYGFAIVDNAIVEDGTPKGELSGDGAYVCIQRDGDTIRIRQDFIGSYGLYLYRDGQYFALSNSFMYLVEQVKRDHKLTFNRDFANFLLAADLCSTAYSETMVNEIRMLDRSAVVEIHIPTKNMEIRHIDYRENTVDLGSPEGMEILDRWYHKWTGLLRNIRKTSSNIQIDLTGGFDSRMTMTLLLGSGVDPSGINVYSANDDLHTHREDFEIASEISGHYGFLLNNFDAASLDKIPNTMEDILNISFYTKLGFHKQMYYSRWKHETNFYYMGGSGGECVRDYWNLSEEAYIEKALKRCAVFPASAARELEASVRRILRTSFDQIRAKFAGFGRSLDTGDMAMNLYRETRCRNHFGKDNIEHYGRGSYKLNPLLDPDLHKLKLNDQVCADRNLLMTVILDRYSADLLNFKFEGGRSIAPETMAYAAKLNAKHPYIPHPDAAAFRPGSTPAAPKSEDFDAIITLEEVRQCVEDLFRSDGIKETFVDRYGEKAYAAICADIQKRSYFALQNAYAVIAISKVMQDVRCSENMNSESLGAYLKLQLRGNAPVKEKEPSLKEHSYLDNYITARVDIKNGPGAGNDIVLLEYSDPDAKVTRPKWFQTNGGGCILESQKGSLSVTFRCVGSGKLNIALRGRDVRNTQGKRIPFWLDYTAFRLNGENFIDGIRPIWHDAPMKLDREVRDGEVLSLYLEWAPHDARNE